MMISLGKDKYKPALKEIWKFCFPMDADDFIHYYFNKVYKNDETLVYLENGKPVAAFQMIPYSLKNGEEIFRAAYISGAMTHPDFQRRRFMKELLLFSFDTMRERGFDYTFLIPQENWLFDFYEKFGYKATEKIGRIIHHRENAPDNSLAVPNHFTASHFAKADKEAVCQVYNRFLSEIPQVILKTDEQFKHILRDFFKEKGVLFANEQGIAFTLREESHIVIKEFFYCSQKIKDLFLKAICEYYVQDEIIILNSLDNLSGNRGMIKRLNNEKPEISSLYINMMLD